MRGEMPFFSPYYGSIDSTPLFLILLSEVYNWTANQDLVPDCFPQPTRRSTGLIAMGIWMVMDFLNMRDVLPRV